MKVAALDLGTNTFLCLIAEVENGKIENILSDRAKVVRLGQGVDKNKVFHADALKRVDACLQDFQKEIEAASVDKVLAVATSAARDVENRQEFFDIANKYGIEPEIISGQREAELTFLGGVCDRDNHEGLMVVDVGGGSTEIIFKSQEVRGESLDIGGVRITERFFTKHPIPAEELQKAEAYVAEKIEDYKNRFLKNTSIEEIVAVAGTPTTLASMVLGKEFDADQIHSFKLKLSDLISWKDRLAEMSVEDRCQLVGLDPGRADIIVAGTIILKAVLEKFNRDEMTVSIRGVRYGLALSGK